MGKIRDFFFPQKKQTGDILGRYPEYMQVRALPERRYLKTSRLLAVFILVNLGITMALAGLYAYVAERVDVSIMSQKAVNLFYIDTEKKQIRATEHETRRYYVTQFVMEDLIRRYITERHAILWDNNKMKARWDRGSFVWGVSAQKTVYDAFASRSQMELANSRSKGYVRDVHLYELEYMLDGRWMAIFDEFDMPIPDSYNPVCNDCQDNSKDCIECKKKIAFDRRRYKVFIRSAFINTKSIGNPLGFMIYSYQVLPMVVKDNDFWDTPRALKYEF